jgi:hypothetical protein
MRHIRTSFHLLLTIGGMLVILYGILAADCVYIRLLYAGLGIVLMEAGIWRITQSIFPDERAYRPLRRETDYFITLVRRLNRAAVSAGRGSTAAEEEMELLHREMLHSVERMRDLAGQTEAQLGYEYKPARAQLSPLTAARSD